MGKVKTCGRNVGHTERAGSHLRHIELGEDRHVSETRKGRDCSGVAANLFFPSFFFSMEREARGKGENERSADGRSYRGSQASPCGVP
jgi:hypothetical protein